MFHDMDFFPASDQFICSQIDKLHSPAKQPDLLKENLLALTNASRQFTLKVGWQPAHDPEGELPYPSHSAQTLAQHRALGAVRGN